MRISWPWRPEAARRALFALRVLLFAAAVPLVLRWRKLASLPAWLEPAGELPPPPGDEEVAALVRRVDALIAAGRPVVRSGCLTRGLTLYRFLRRAGADVSLRFGVGTVRDRFAAHCWIVYRGEPLAERRDPRAVYAETWRIDPGRPSASGSPPRKEREDEAEAALLLPSPPGNGEGGWRRRGQGW